MEMPLVPLARCFKAALAIVRPVVCFKAVSSLLLPSEHCFKAGKWVFIIRLSMQTMYSVRCQYSGHLSLLLSSSHNTFIIGRPSLLCLLL